VMCNTGMRPPKAKNLRWRDVTITAIRKDTKGKENRNAEIPLGRNDLTKIEATLKAQKGGVADANAEEERKIVILDVQGKDKFRRLVAPSNVAKYLERIRAIAKVTGSEDYVFTTIKGKQAQSLYASLVKDLLVDANLLKGPQGSDRSTYCFRHTYVPDHPFAPRSAAASAGHVGIHRGLVKKGDGSNQAALARESIVGGRAPRLPAPVRWRAGLFFARDAVALQKPKQRRAASRKPARVHRRDDLVQCPITLLCDKAEDLIGVIVQRLDCLDGCDAGQRFNGGAQ